MRSSNDESAVWDGHRCLHFAICEICYFGESRVCCILRYCHANPTSRDGFSYIRGLVHSQFFRQAVNREFYCNVLRHLKEDVWRKRPDLWCVKNWLFHHDNAPCHRSLLTRDFLAKTNIVSLSNPHDSPYLALEGFHIFSKQKMHINDRRFNRVVEIQRESQKVLNMLTGNYF